MKATSSWILLLHGWHLVAFGLLLTSLILAGGCEALKPAVSPHPNLYTLSGTSNNVIPVRLAQRAALAAPTLIVSPLHAAAGFDSKRIIYMRRADQIEYFAHNEWIDTPARMLAPLIVTAIERSGAFRAVVQTPSTAAGEMRLDIEILRLQHEFLSVPSYVRFTLRAYLVDSKTRRVIASREFDSSVPSVTEDPHGGVVAANRAVQSVLDNLSVFCADVTHSARLKE